MRDPDRGMHSPRVGARVSDACQVPQDLQPVAGIFSCLGLQQMPEPKQVPHLPVCIASPPIISGRYPVLEGPREGVKKSHSFFLNLKYCNLPGAQPVAAHARHDDCQL